MTTRGFIYLLLGLTLAMIAGIATAQEIQQCAAYPEWMDITPEQGSQIAIAIITIWGIAFGFRLLIRTLDIDSSSSERNQP